jgi:hypothetical protein
MKLPNIAEIRKATVPLVAAVAADAAELIKLGLVHGTPLAIATAIVGIATALGVYKVSNAPKANA